jgi:hypothetical protein
MARVRSAAVGKARHEGQLLLVEEAEEDRSSTSRDGDRLGLAYWAPTLGPVPGMSYWEGQSRVLSAASDGQQQAVVAVADVHMQMSYEKRRPGRY